MAKTIPTTVTLVGDPNRRQREASAVVTPGFLIELAADNTVAPHSGAGTTSSRWVAVENDIAGDDLNHDYQSGEVVLINVFRPGDEFLGILVAGQNAAIGAFLTSNGDGKLKVATGGDVRVAMAVKAVDVSGTGDPDGRIHAQVL